MWMALTSGLSALASASADDAGKVISEGVPENIQPVDAGIPGFDGKLPTPEQLLEMLDSMTGISDEDKLSLKEDLLKNIQERASASQTFAGDDITTQTLMLLGLLSLVALIFEDVQEKLATLLPERAQEKLSSLLSESGQEKLSGLLERYQQLNDEEKKEFMGEAFGMIKKSLQDKVSDYSSTYSSLWLMRSYILFCIALLFLVVILVFFIYKLFKCLKEREAKREEKKKNKQLKKKK